MGPSATRAAYENGAERSGPPLVLSLHEVAGDDAAHERAEAWLRAAGRVAVEATVGYEPIAETASAYPTLKDAIQAASHDPVARRVVRQNVMSDLWERSMKAGIVMKVPMSLTPGGRITQHGTYMEDVFKNAWQLIGDNWQMRERTRIETHNGAQLESPGVQQLLQDYYAVTFSCAPDNLSEAAAEKIGFFPDTMTCAIQVIGKRQGELFQESVLVAGRSRPGAVRHDLQTVPAVVARLGLGDMFAGRTAAEMLAQPLLVHKSLLEHGITSLVELYDEAAGGTFFGQDKPRQDYAAYARLCEWRETQLEPTAQRVVDALLGQAAALRAPEDAVKLLHQLSQRELVDRSFKDLSIDPRVFGTEAAMHIAAARALLAQGKTDAFLEARGHAQRTAHSASCPQILRAAEQQEGQQQDEGPASELKKMACPFCGDKQQYGDPCSLNQFCTNCKAYVYGGKVISEGDGGPGKRAERIARMPLLRLARHERPAARQAARGVAAWLASQRA